MNDIETVQLTEEQLNLLLIWFSPAFPIGSFSYSHGLETMVMNESVCGPESLKDWVETVMLQGSGQTDGVIFREAYRAVQEHDSSRLCELALLSAALLPTEELALESQAQGEAFMAAAGNIWQADKKYPTELSGTTLAIAAAVTCAAHAIPLGYSLSSWYHATASSLVSAGVRLIPLGQTAGLNVLVSLADTVVKACKQARTISLEDIGSSAPMLDLGSIHHETIYSRLFRS